MATPRLGDGPGEPTVALPRCCSLFCDVHTKFIVGVGLPVFYNFHVLPAVAALFTMLAVHQSLSTSGYSCDCVLTAARIPQPA